MHHKSNVCFSVGLYQLSPASPLFNQGGCLLQALQWLGGSSVCVAPSEVCVPDEKKQKVFRLPSKLVSWLQLWRRALFGDSICRFYLCSYTFYCNYE